MLAYVIEAGSSPQLKAVGEDLPSLQAEVGGQLEAIQIPDERSPLPLTALINEDGKGMALPPNATATRLIYPLLLPGDYIVGTMLIVGSDNEGNFVSLPEDFHPVEFFYPL